MNAYIKIWGNEYFISSLDWRADGTFSHASFLDENGEIHTVFDGSILRVNDAEENRYADKHLHAYLNEIIIFKNENSRARSTTKQKGFD